MCKPAPRSGKLKTDAEGNQGQIIGAKCDDQFSVQVNRRSATLCGPPAVGLTAERLGAKYATQYLSQKDAFASLRRVRRLPSWRIGSVVVFLPTLPTCGLCRLSSASQPLCRTLGRTTRRGPPVPPSGAGFRPYARLKAEVAAIPSRVLSANQGRPAKLYRAAGSPKGPRADTYTSIYIGFAKPKRPLSGTITSESQSLCAPKKAAEFLQLKRAINSRCGEARSLKAPINLIKCRLKSSTWTRGRQRNAGATEQGWRG
jgi:hypothetical protein